MILTPCQNCCENLGKLFSRVIPYSHVHSKHLSILFPPGSMLPGHQLSPFLQTTHKLLFFTTCSTPWEILANQRKKVYKRFRETISFQEAKPTSTLRLGGMRCSHCRLHCFLVKVLKLLMVMHKDGQIR